MQLPIQSQQNPWWLSLYWRTTRRQSTVVQQVTQATTATWLSNNYGNTRVWHPLQQWPSNKQQEVAQNLAHTASAMYIHKDRSCFMPGLHSWKNIAQIKQKIPACNSVFTESLVIDILILYSVWLYHQWTSGFVEYICTIQGLKYPTSPITIYTFNTYIYCQK